MGCGVVLYGGFEICGPGKLKIGEHTGIGPRATLDARGGLKIGARVTMSSEVLIGTAQHDYQDPGFRAVFKPVTVWNYGASDMS